MRFKRFLSAALGLALTVGLLTVPASAASFTDLGALPEVSEAAEFLRLMGVVTGVPGGAYNPSGTLSRAEFCAMAVRALDRADEEPAQRSRTIYLDVGPTFWATGYINLASVITLGGGPDGGGTPLVAGVGDGTFQPDRAITYGEAVTILCRMLGYGAGDVATGGAWYDGYLTAGAVAGLTEGLSLSGTDVIDRGQAAILFYNLYFSKTKGGKDTYLVTMGGKEVEGGIILDVNATADDNSPAVKTTEGTYKTDRTFDAALVGRRGKALLDADGKLLAFSPKENTTQKVVNVTDANATYLIASGGERITVEPETVVYQKGEASTWKDVWTNLSTPTPVTFHYDANGKLAYLFFSSASEEGSSSMVARTNPSGSSNPFASLASGGTYTMYKNGVAATSADIRQYDVATFDAGTRVIQVSDLKLTGIYEDASPSPTAPITIKVMGKDDFKVLPSARKDLEDFKIGDQITLLLTVEGDVAGVVPASVVKGDAVGVASVSGEGSDKTAEVTLLQGGLKVSGKVSSSADRYNNQLVTVTSGAKDRLSLSAISGSSARADLDVGARKLGDRDVAENVLVYDRVLDGDTVKVNYEDLTQSTISRSKISFVSYDYAGRVKCLVLDDVTGDAYEYGYLHSKTEQITVPPLSGDEPSTYDQITLWVLQGDENGGEVEVNKGRSLMSIRNNVPGGIALDASGRVAATVTLQSLTHVARSAFDPEEMTVTVAGVSYPISSEVQCYNKTTKTWFKMGKEGMEAARAYSNDLTLYYDRSPADGGKVRMIVVP